VTPPLTLDPVPITLPPGQDRVTVNDVPVPAVVRANDTNDTLVVEGPRFAAQLACIDRSARPVPLGAQGVLQCVRGRVLRVSGTGYRANAPVRIYLTSGPTPRLLGELATDGTGFISGAVELPSDGIDGPQTVQVIGYTPANQVLRLALGARVIDPETVTEQLGSRVVFSYKSAALTPQARRALRALIEQVPVSSKPITVAAGVVRAKGATRAERALATKRAQRVARFLAANGMEGSIRVRTTTVAVQHRAQDRRVDVTVRFTVERF
jgi:hypothetical protein